MTELLIHSMAELADLVLGTFQIAGVKDVVEIGSEAGDMTAMLLEYSRLAGGSMVAIDPAPEPEVEDRLAACRYGRLVKDSSLRALRGISGDAFLVDGDHNYYTVLNESRAIWERARATGGRFLALYHDIGWPWARRDQYLDPTRIPAEFLHPHVWDRGVTLGVPGTIEGGFRGEGRWACAACEGGPRNGVLTAIEDFVIGRESELVWACVPGVFGLGILYDRHAPWTDSLTGFLEPYHMNPLLETLEQNRLACYLGVIEWQDKHRAA